MLTVAATLALLAPARRAGPTARALRQRAARGVTPTELRDVARRGAVAAAPGRPRCWACSAS